jgi:hypothetical protein
MATHPLRADSDGDTYYDFDEANRASSPCGPDHPPYHLLPKMTLLGQATLDFVAASNAWPTDPQEIQILNLGGGDLNWTAQASDPWITLGAASGGDLSTLPIGVNPAGLAPGHYSGSVTITGVNGAGSGEGIGPGSETATIVVSLDMLPPKQADLLFPFISSLNASR